jgi:hypothetical protein
VTPEPESATVASVELTEVLSSEPESPTLASAELTAVLSSDPDVDATSVVSAVVSETDGLPGSVEAVVVPGSGSLAESCDGVDGLLDCTLTGTV